MAITREKKKEILARLSDIVKSAKTVVFVGFHGLTVGDTVSMRQTLKDENVSYLVAKKRLIRKAIENNGVAGTMPELPGEVAIAYTTEDPVAPARLIHTVKKQYAGVSILGGIFEESLIDAVAMQEIATIPSLQGLRGMFANVINSPIQGLVIALGQIAEKKSS